MLVDDAQYSIFPTEAEMRGRVSLDAPVKRSSSYAAMPRTNDVNLHRMKSLSSLPESVLGLHRELALEPEPSTAGALLGASSDGELRAACRQRSRAGSAGRRRGRSRSGRDGVQTVELREEEVEDLALDAATRGPGRAGAAPPRPLQLPPPGAASVRFRAGGASLSPEQRARSERLRAAVWRRWEEEAPEATVLAPIRAHARSAAGQPAASGLSAWAQRHEVLAG